MRLLSLLHVEDAVQTDDDTVDTRTHKLVQPAPQCRIHAACMTGDRGKECDEHTRIAGTVLLSRQETTPHTLERVSGLPEHAHGMGEAEQQHREHEPNARTNHMASQGAQRTAHMRCVVSKLDPVVLTAPLALPICQSAGHRSQVLFRKEIGASLHR